MRGFLIRSLITAFGVWLAATLVPGIRADGTSTVLLAGLLLVCVNAVVRPILVVLTLPVTLLTLGLFLLVINGMMLGLVAKLLGGLHVASLWSAVMGSIIVSLISTIASWYVGPHGRYEVLMIRRRGHK